MPTVLIVDDCHTTQRVVSSYLREHDFRVWQALSLLEMEQRLATGTPSIILLDVNLPDGNGIYVPSASRLANAMV